MPANDRLFTSGTLGRYSRYAEYGDGALLSSRRTGGGRRLRSFGQDCRGQFSFMDFCVAVKKLSSR